MIVAMAAVGVMQVPTDEIVDMVSVRHGLVAAARPVPVALVVSRAGVVGGVRRQRSLDRTGGLKKGEFLAHRNVHRSEDETANSIIEGAG